MFRKDKSVKMSLPQEKVVHGVKIVKLPVARYVAALSTLEHLPQLLVSELIPEADSVENLLTKLITADKITITRVLTNLLTTVPSELCNLLSELLGIPCERLLNPDCKDPLTLNDLIEIILAFWEINDMTDFFCNVRKLLKLTARTTTTAATGSSGGLQ